MAELMIPEWVENLCIFGGGVFTGIAVAVAWLELLADGWGNG